MKTIGLFYAMNAAKTSHIAEKIREDLGGVKVIEVVLIEKAWQNDFQAYDNMIVGASTWFDGELPTYWDELVPELESLDLKGKKVAIFGLGDQKNYPDNFVDGMGILADAFKRRGLSWSVLLRQTDIPSTNRGQYVVKILRFGN